MKCHHVKLKDLSWHLMTWTWWGFWWHFIIFDYFSWHFSFLFFFFSFFLQSLLLNTWNDQFHFKCHHPDVIICHKMSFNLTWWHLMTCHDISWCGQSDSERNSQDSFVNLSDWYLAYFHFLHLLQHLFSFHFHDRQRAVIDKLHKQSKGIQRGHFVISLILCHPGRDKVQPCFTALHNEWSH